MNIQGQYVYIVESYPYDGAQVFAKYEDAEQYIKDLAKRNNLEWNARRECYTKPNGYDLYPKSIKIR